MASTALYHTGGQRFHTNESNKIARSETPDSTVSVACVELLAQPKLAYEKIKKEFTRVRLRPEEKCKDP